MVEKVRNEDFSVYFFVKDTLTGKNINVVDAYPFAAIINETLALPTVSIEHRQTEDDMSIGELGASWFRRSWAIDVFAENKTRRDDIADLIFTALDKSIPIKDYSGGYNKGTGKSLLGADLQIIEYMLPENRLMRPIYTFSDFNKQKFWRITITFSTVSTQAV